MKDSGVTMDVLRSALKDSNGVHLAKDVEGRIARYQLDIKENPFGGNIAAAGR